MLERRRTVKAFTRPAAISRMIADKTKYAYKSNTKLKFYESKYQSLHATANASVSSTCAALDESVKVKKSKSALVKRGGQQEADLSLHEQMIRDAQELQEQLQKRGYEVHVSSSEMKSQLTSAVATVSASQNNTSSSSAQQDKKAMIVGRIRISIRTPEPPPEKPIVKEEEVKVIKVEPKVVIEEIKAKEQAKATKTAVKEEYVIKRIEPVKRVVKTMEIVTPIVTKTTTTTKIVPVTSSTTHHVSKSGASSSSKTFVTTQGVKTTKTFVTTTTKVVKAR